jgi:dynein heavy chain 1
MNGLSVFQIKVHNKYSAEDFDDDLRTVLRRSGCKGEKIAFIMDESNVLDSGFLERMNTLLANAEVPGLFEGDEHAALMTACKEGAQRDGLMLDSPEELYRWFTQQVARNLHVVFTMNPPSGGLASRAATSPALFNRCVLDWFGDWSDQAFYQVGMEFTNTLDLDVATYSPPATFPIAYRQLSLPPHCRAAVINALVFVHQSMYETNAKLARRQGRTNHATPRHYLDFINQYVRIFNEKRDELEEQQRHLNVGLEKLHTTVIQVEELRKSLAVKRIELETKNAEANDKLKRMVEDQQDAEHQKLASIKIQAALKEQTKAIEERTSTVMSQLADAEPAVADAQAAVRDIKKQHLTEVRSMSNPPEAVKLAMESVCTVLGFKIDSWKTVQSIIRRDDFIASIVNFDTTGSMTRKLREQMKREFLSLPGFNFESVNRASKACGPLCKWVIAQVNYSDILDQVGPLRAEVQSLEAQADETKDQASTIITMIAELEARIASYKDEYALLISETQTIKTEMERVQKRVDRSITLLDSLSSEKTRWEAGSKTFESQMSTVAGDVLLSSAFLAYGGYFDQQYRQSMWQGWSNHLADAGIKFKPELSLSEYLSTADDRLSWQARSLPADDLCTENAIMLKRFDRYPLIIDPSGQATAFLLNEYRDRKISVTSFLDEAFLKNLESALRFGTPLLIQDVEHLDPILNAVLNKELRRAGGRVLMRLGNNDIDFSPAFTMFLTTRDPSVEFAADLNSRVTMVNFSVSLLSLSRYSRLTRRYPDHSCESASSVAQPSPSSRATRHRPQEIRPPSSPRRVPSQAPLPREAPSVCAQRVAGQHPRRRQVSHPFRWRRTCTDDRSQGHRDARDAQARSCGRHEEGRGDRRRHGGGRASHERVPPSRSGLQLDLLRPRRAQPPSPLLPILPPILPRHLRLCPPPQPLAQGRDGPSTAPIDPHWRPLPPRLQAHVSSPPPFRPPHPRRPPRPGQAARRRCEL